MSHAYLFLSIDDFNNSLFVKELAKLILCDTQNNCDYCPSCLKVLAESHPDMLIYPKNKNFLVDDANDINLHILERPIISDKKIFIINNIDEATVQAQNKILKTLEEPPKSVIFLLTAKNKNKILPTIISRTRKVELSPLPTKEIRQYILNLNEKYEEELINNAVEYGNGWIGKTLKALNSSSFLLEKKLAKDIVEKFNSSKDLSLFSFQILNYKENISSFLEILSNEFSNRLNSNNYEKVEGIIKILEEINLANQNLDRNVNVNLIVDNLLMKVLEYKYIYQIN
jgi:DNA polymerase-3 subunit delta'